jgi:hypothetical protein
VTIRNVIVGGTPRIAIMFTDATGVYEVTQTVANGPWVVNWMLPNNVYRFMRNRPGAPPTIFGSNPLSVRPNYARRLDSGEVIVVNGYVGRRINGTDFSGEVVQVDGEPYDPATNSGFGFNRPNLGFNFASVRFELSTPTETRSLYQPVFADRR